MDLVSWTFGGSLPDPDKPILIDALAPDNWLSHRLLTAKVRKLIAGLRANGIRTGDCVCVNCFNDLHYSVLYFGIIGAGAIFTGINPSFTPNELRHHFDLTRPSLLIVEPPMLEKTLAAAELAGISAERIYAFDTDTACPDSTIPTWTLLLDHGESDWVTVPNPETTVATYNSTSGTSGLPKAAMITHSYHVTQAAAQCEQADYFRSRLLTLPPFHAFGSPILPSSIRQGIPTYIMRRYAESHFLDSIARFRITETYVPPPVLLALPKSAMATPEQLRSLRSIWMGGASVKFAQQKPLYDLLHEDACVRSVWGMTESGWITCVQDRTRREDDSVGQPLHGFDITIIDDDGDPITTDYVSGELLARVPHPLLAYISNPTATSDAFTPCKTYLRTGDIGYRVTDSATGIPSFYIIDRAKELIKVRGWQVSPTEVESELMQHPAIADAAVIGIKEPNGVEEFIRAYVVRKVSTSDGAPIDNTVLRKWLRERLAGYKVPAEFVFVPTVPRNGTGKILRRVLRDGQVNPQRVSHKRVDSAMSEYSHATDSSSGNVPPLQEAYALGRALSRVKSEGNMASADHAGVGEANQSSAADALVNTSSPETLPDVVPEIRRPRASMRKRLKRFVLMNNERVTRTVLVWKHKLSEVKRGFRRH